MHGNMWEWVQDRYDEDYYAESPVMDPEGPDTGNARVRRGGIYNNRAEGVRSARREGSNPASDDVSFGFRLVMLDEPVPLSVDGGGAAGAEVLALTSTLLVSIFGPLSHSLARVRARRGGAGGWDWRRHSGACGQQLDDAGLFPGWLADHQRQLGGGHDAVSRCADIWGADDLWLY